MDFAARRFARNILILHFMLLALVAGLVVYAAREVYDNAHAQALGEAQSRQRLLAAQTARGIENFYTSILANLDLLKRTEEGEMTPAPQTGISSRTPAAEKAGIRAFTFAPALWNQLQGRASHLFAVDRITMKIHRSFPENPPISAHQIAKDSENWLKSVEGPSISKLMMIGDQYANLAAVPLAGEERRLLVAAVPINEVQTRFFGELRSQSSVHASLLDQEGDVLIHSERKLIGTNVRNNAQSARIRELAEEHLRTGERGDAIFDRPEVINGVKLQPAILTMQPAHLADNHVWWIVLRSNLADVDEAVNQLFQRALYGAIFIIAALTAILVSTAIQMIRGRARLERMRHDLLTKELSQAREIQLAWLPEQGTTIQSLDIAAVNQPASHISGDFYNWFALPDGRVVVTIGDVTGHGMSAAFLMATTQMLVRTTMMRVTDPGRCLEEVNHQLCIQVFNGQFVTMLILVLDVEHGVVDIATAGHPPPLLGEGESFQPLAVEPQLVLGVERDSQFPTQRFNLSPGSSLLLYTDGVVEAEADIAAGGPRFTVAGLRRSLFGRFTSAQAIIDAVIDAVNEFRGRRELADDLTLVAIQLQPAEIDKGQLVATA